MLELVVLAAFWWWRLNESMAPSAWLLWFPSLCVAACVGVWRGVVWGQVLHSIVSLLLAFTVPLALGLQMGRPFARLFGTQPPLLLAWLIIVMAAVAILAPAVAIGWRKRWFRSAFW